MDSLNHALEATASAMASVLFFDVGAGIPLIVALLVLTALFFTLYLGGVNLRLLPHALKIVSGKVPEHGASGGEVSPLQALLSAVAATVGLGSIAGVAIAVALGGPGAIFWIVVMGVFGMASKFAEVTLSMRYRHIGADGKVYGGPIHYLEKGFAAKNMPRLGKLLAMLFAVLCLGGALGGGNMFQSNQTVKILIHEMPALAEFRWAVSAAFALFVGLVLFGSIKRIAKVAEAVAPLKGIVYLACALVVMATHASEIIPSLMLIAERAFAPDAVSGGMVGMLIIAFKRALFANEAGLGSAPIAHAAARTNEPVREGAVALIEPLFAAFIALLTGLIVIVTGAYETATMEDGVLMVAAAFASVGQWFTILLAVNVFLFAYGTTIGWSYYGEIAWSYLFGKRAVTLYYLIFCAACFAGGIAHFSVVVDLSDLFILGMALPNILALLVLRREIKSAMRDYIAKLA